MFLKTLAINEKLWKNQGRILTKLIISQLKIALDYQTDNKVMVKHSSLT